MLSSRRPMDETPRPYVTVVLPSYRAADVLARSVPRLLAFLESLQLCSEVIVVDDGSDDDGRTKKVAERLGCVFIGLERNRGKGAAVRRGMLGARGRYVMFTDADVPFELDTIKTALHYLDFKEFHFVAGDRTLRDSVYFARLPRSRRIASAICSFIVGRFITTGWFDTQCGLKGFQASVAKDLFGVARVDRFAFDVELFYVALKRNYDIKRIPVRLVSNDTSSVRLARDGFSFAIDLLRIRWRQLWGQYRERSPSG